MGPWQSVMPLSKIQSEVLALISVNRSPESHLAGATGIHMSPQAPRVSHDLDLFHSTEEAVAEAFVKDALILREAGYRVDVMLSQPGYIRSRVGNGSQTLLIEWAHDSIWRFMALVSLEGIGWVLHPVDLAVNKVLALGGRDEARDYLDSLYLHEKVLSLGALVWAAAGKDPGMNPRMLLELLQRKGHLREEELMRLDLSVELNFEHLRRTWKQALKEALDWISQRPAEEAGCLYADPESGRLIAPGRDEKAEILHGQPGGVFPRIQGVPARSFIESAELRAAIEGFFHRKIR